MKASYKKLICCIFTVFILASGLSLDNVYADALNDCKIINQTISYIQSFEQGSIEDEEFKIETLETCDSEYVVNIIRRSTTRIEDRNINLVWVSGILSQDISKCHIVSETVNIKKLYKNTPILNYIHKQDGKK